MAWLEELMEPLGVQPCWRNGSLGLALRGHSFDPLLFFSLYFLFAIGDVGLNFQRFLPVAMPLFKPE